MADLTAKDDRTSEKKNKRTIGYKDYVSVVNMVDYKDIKTSIGYRFLIEYHLQNEDTDRSALVIMKNPSKADKKVSDDTVNRVLEIMYRCKYSNVLIMNLFPKYATDPKDLGEVSEDILRINDEILSYVAGKNVKIFLGWGDRCGVRKAVYKLRISSVRERLEHKRVFCYQITAREKNPIHPSYNHWRKDACEDDFKVYHWECLKV